jgi:hypothetical protein
MAKGTLTILKTDGTTFVKDYDHKVPLEELQAGVGGLIELVPHLTSYKGKPCVAFCNENGKLDGLGINPLAQAVWVAALKEVALKPWDILLGDVVVLTGDEGFLE